MSKPCVNCGQTRGKRVDISIIGNLHDHICADCGREMPVPDKLPNKLQQFLFVDIDDTYTLKYDGYREKNHWTLIRKGHITEGGGRVFDGDFYDVVAYLTGFEKEEILDGR